MAHPVSLVLFFCLFVYCFAGKDLPHCTCSESEMQTVIDKSKSAQSSECMKIWDDCKESGSCGDNDPKCALKCCSDEDYKIRVRDCMKKKNFEKECKKDEFVKALKETCPPPKDEPNGP